MELQIRAEQTDRRHTGTTYVVVAITVVTMLLSAWELLGRP